MSKGIKGYTA